MANFIHIILLEMDIDTIRTNDEIKSGILQGKRVNKARKLVKELIEDGGEQGDKDHSSHVNPQ